MFQLFRSPSSALDWIMPSAVAPLIREVGARARRDSSFAQLLNVLLDAPASPQGTLEGIAARELNDQRRGAVVRDFVDGAMPTPKVQRLLGRGSPQAVHRLRSRGKLLGVAVGNQTWFPAWQFDEGRLRSDLARILELLGRFSSDPIAADRVMRMKQDDLSGRSIAEALRHGETADTAWRMLASVGA
jgi:hypothetical protein